MIPLWYLLALYFILLVGIAILALVNLWHLLAFSHDLLAYVSTGIALVGFLAISLLSWQAILGVDWNAEVDLVKLIPFL